MRFDLLTRCFVERTHDGKHPAVVGDDRTLTWRALADEAEAWCAAAEAAGFSPDTPVIVRGHKEASFFVAITGALMLGTPFVPLDTLYPGERMRSIARTLDAHVYYDARSRTFKQIEAAAVNTPPPRALPEKGLAYVLFTSGTTGEPKGVQIGLESVDALANWIAADFALGPAPVFMNQAPFSFDLSMYEVFGTLSLGGTIVLMSRAASAPGAAFVERLARERIDTWVSTPSFAQQQLIESTFNGTSLPKLRTFLFCGEVLPVPLARRLRERFAHARIINTYGPTEATVATTWIVVDDALLDAHPQRLPIGRARPNGEVFVDGGELCIAGPHVMRGYLNRDDLNATRMFEHHGMRALRTGDLGSMRDDGLLFCDGRIDDQVKLDEYRIELGEIDAAFGTLPTAPRAAAVALRRPDGAVARIVAFVETGSHDALPALVASDWKARLAERLPPYMIPSELIACRALPVTVNLKIDRARLADEYRHAQLDRPGR
ncbi:AMP-binding protein [Burkholderia sp. TSV86]|uniref:AMP-binding protein n=1 Tax=Burkholderia sp. TSV86 TaxID=1385594 RepID=UPI0007587D90|nr:AMP-binding protein [Burkholderia sp. TSV86]KVE36519.1 D-alanine--poly(phosphoribitol) ligase [Burkholderia sp. TSV86]